MKATIRQTTEINEQPMGNVEMTKDGGYQYAQQTTNMKVTNKQIACDKNVISAPYAIYLEVY